MKIDPMIQMKLKELGFDPGDIDGIQGKLTTDAIIAYQKSVGLKPDGWAGTRTIRALMGKPKTTEPVVGSKFNATSIGEIEHLEPDLKRLVLEASKLIDIEVLDSRRGKAEQERAFNQGHSKVHFGQSAHNYDPAIATDIVPDPLNWNDKQSFLRVQRVIGFWNPDTKAGHGLAKDMGISIRWLGDPNMDGDVRDGWDFPHYERYPWRKFTSKANLYKG